MFSLAHLSHAVAGVASGRLSDRACYFGAAQGRPRQGLSLLEVLIATGILAASAMLLTSLIGTGADLATRAEQRAEALMLCQNRMADFVLSAAEDRAEGEQSGACPESEAWSYRLVAEAVELPSSDSTSGGGVSPAGARAAMPSTTTKTRLLRVTVEVFPSETQAGMAMSRPNGPVTGDGSASSTSDSPTPAARLVQWIRVRPASGAWAGQ